MWTRTFASTAFAALIIGSAAAFSPALEPGIAGSGGFKTAQAGEPPAEPQAGSPTEAPASNLTAPPAETAPAETTPAPAPEPGSPAEATQQTEQSPVPGVLRGEAAMPEPVRETWRQLVEAARSGEVERLRPIMEGQPEPPSVAFDEIDDPIEYLKSLSGDAEGREILAILLEVLESGFIHVDSGTPQEMFVWPYFAQYPLETLTPPQFVELFRLLTSADYQEMRSYGAYIFFRVGIAPVGTWRFFIAGD